MLHDILDFFSLLIAILALVALFVDPAGKRRQLFLKIALCTAFGVLLAYAGYVHWQSREEQRANDQEVRAKEKLVIDTLCRENEMNFEQLYNETSQGFSDGVLNQAIDDLTQDKRMLKTRWIETRVPTMPTARPLTIRLYYVDRTLCPTAPSVNP
jgi:hypothetical protein